MPKKKITFDELFERLPEGLREQLKNCPQDPLYHPEGSVYNHMKLVSENLPADDIDYQMATLFHDMGKLVTVNVVYKEDKIRIQNIGHEQYAKEYIVQFRNLFSDLVYDEAKVMAICMNHMVAHKYLSGEMKKLHKRQTFEALPYFKNIVEFSKADEDGIGKDTGKSIVVFTVGIPGSGKSTWCKTYANKEHFLWISSDLKRKEFTSDVSDQSKNGEVWKALKVDLLTAIDLHMPYILFDSTMCNLATVKEFITLVRGKAIIVFKLFPITSKEAKDRIRQDLENKVERSNVPDEVVDRMRVGYGMAVSYIENANEMHRNVLYSE